MAAGLGVRVFAVATSATLALVLGNGCSASSAGGSSSVPASSCTGAPITVLAPDSVDSLYGNEGAACSWGTGGVTFGMKPAGAACATPTDCTPTCCACPNASYHSIATWCGAGVCATPEQTCCMILGSHDCG